MSRTNTALTEAAIARLKDLGIYTGVPETDTCLALIFYNTARVAQRYETGEAVRRIEWATAVLQTVDRMEFKEGALKEAEAAEALEALAKLALALIPAEKRMAGGGGPAIQ